MSHTPGPWSVTKASNGGKLVKRGVNPDLSVQSLQVFPDADAHLMAAAPELIASVSELLEELESTPIPEANCSCHISSPCNDCVNYGRLREVIKSAYAALAKAGGRS